MMLLPWEVTTYEATMTDYIVFNTLLLYYKILGGYFILAIMNSQTLHPVKKTFIVYYNVAFLKIVVRQLDL